MIKNAHPDPKPHAAKVLIVDDEPQNRRLLEVMLQPEGYQLLNAANGVDALALVKQHAPDLILLDLMMPGMDGYEVAAQVKHEPSTASIPIILITALDDRDSRMRGLTTGAEDFLSKPVDRAELCTRVRNLLRLKAYGDHFDRYSETLEREVLARTAELVDRTTALEQQTVKLRENEERTEYAHAAAGMGVWELDLVTQTFRWSGTMAAVMGVAASTDPTTTEGFLALVHKDDRRMVADSLAALAEKGTEYNIEFRVPLRDANTHWVAGRARLVRDEQGNPIRLTGIGTDISARKSLEAQLRQAQKMEAVGQLAGGVAHDFNNLLTAILGYSNLVLETLEPGDERRSELEEVIKAGNRATALTTQLLAFSRTQVLQPTAVDLNALITGMRDMLSRLIGEQIEFVPLLAADAHPVRADAGQVEQILMNLVINARDAMPSGGRLSVETSNEDLDHDFVTDTAIVPGHYVMLAVSDNGKGMTDATKQRLFEPFFTTKGLGKGTGLGLATVYGIVKQSAGYIWVYSEIGRGATFKVYLPRATADTMPQKAPAAVEAIPRGSETVLVVEDEESVRNLTRRILEKAGYRVFDAANPERAEALFRIQPEVFDLLLTDVIMPGASGPALFEKLARKQPRLKALYVSGYTDDSIVRQGQLDPGVQFLQKPFTAHGLNERVREILDSAAPGTTGGRH